MHFVSSAGCNNCKCFVQTSLDSFTCFSGSCFASIKQRGNSSTIATNYIPIRLPYQSLSQNNWYTAEYQLFRWGPCGWGLWPWCLTSSRRQRHWTEWAEAKASLGVLATWRIRNVQKVWDCCVRRRIRTTMFGSLFQGPRKDWKGCSLAFLLWHQIGFGHLTHCCCSQWCKGFVWSVFDETNLFSRTGKFPWDYREGSLCRFSVSKALVAAFFPAAPVGNTKRKCHLSWRRSVATEALQCRAFDQGKSTQTENDRWRVKPFQSEILFGVCGVVSAQDARRRIERLAAVLRSDIQSSTKKVVVKVEQKSELTLGQNVNTFLYQKCMWIELGQNFEMKGAIRSHIGHSQGQFWSVASDKSSCCPSTLQSWKLWLGRPWKTSTRTDCSHLASCYIRWQTMWCSDSLCTVVEAHILWGGFSGLGTISDLTGPWERPWIRCLHVSSMAQFRIDELCFRRWQPGCHSSGGFQHFEGMVATFWANWSVCIPFEPRSQKRWKTKTVLLSICARKCSILEKEVFQLLQGTHWLERVSRRMRPTWIKVAFVASTGCYHSAFDDTDHFFGSRGSFFDAKFQEGAPIPKKHPEITKWPNVMSTLWFLEINFIVRFGWSQPSIWWRSRVASVQILPKLPGRSRAWSLWRQPDHKYIICRVKDMNRPIFWLLLLVYGSKQRQPGVKRTHVLLLEFLASDSSCPQGKRSLAFVIIIPETAPWRNMLCCKLCIQTQNYAGCYAYYALSF